MEVYNIAIRKVTLGKLKNAARLREIKKFKLKKVMVKQ